MQFISWMGCSHWWAAQLAACCVFYVRGFVRPRWHESSDDSLDHLSDEPMSSEDGESLFVGIKPASVCVIKLHVSEKDQQ